MIDERFVDELILPEVHRSPDRQDPIEEMDCSLFKKTGNQIQEEFAREYSFDAAGQASTWALDILQNSSRLDMLLTSIIYRFRKGDFSLISDLVKAPEVLIAINFEAILIAYQLSKLLPFLYDDVEFSETYKNAPIDHSRYLERFKAIDLPNLKLYTDSITTGMYEMNLSIPTFYGLLDEIPKQYREYNPVVQVSVAISLSKAPVLSLGSAITNVIRGMNAYLQKIIVGDRLFIQNNKEDLKRFLSTTLNAVTYVGAEKVFMKALLFGHTSLPDYSDYLFVNNLTHSKDLWQDYCNLTTPMISTYTAETAVGLSKC